MEKKNKKQRKLKKTILRKSKDKNMGIYLDSIMLLMCIFSCISFVSATSFVNFRTSNLTYVKSNGVNTYNMSIAFNLVECGGLLIHYGSTQTIMTGTGSGSLPVLFPNIVGNISSGDCGVNSTNIKLYDWVQHELGCVVVGGNVNSPLNCGYAWRGVEFCLDSSYGYVDLSPNVILSNYEVLCNTESFIPYNSPNQYAWLFIIDFTQKINIILLVIFFIVILMLLYYKYLIFASILTIILGFIFLFSGVALLFSFIVIVIGVIFSFIFGGKH